VEYWAILQYTLKKSGPRKKKRNRGGGNLWSIQKKEKSIRVVGFEKEGAQYKKEEPTAALHAKEGGRQGEGKGSFGIGVPRKTVAGPSEKTKLKKQGVRKVDNAVQTQEKEGRAVRGIGEKGKRMHAIHAKPFPIIQLGGKKKKSTKNARALGPTASCTNTGGARSATKRVEGLWGVGGGVWAIEMCSNSKSGQYGRQTKASRGKHRMRRPPQTRMGGAVIFGRNWGSTLQAYASLKKTIDHNW